MIRLKSTIPTYELENLTDGEGNSSGVFFLGRQSGPQTVAIDIPYRRNFYAVGICIRGRAELKANLETYLIEENSLVAKPPFTINQWTYLSEDFETLTIFFTKEFITAGNMINLNGLGFFDMGARHVIPTTPPQARAITAYLLLLREKYGSPQPFREQIMKSLLNSLLYEMASVYSLHNASPGAVPTRSQLLAQEFKNLVGAHFKTERSLSFYAAKLFITPKYLTETVREVTGRTAGSWIAEAVTLEAKVLLQNPALSIAQISDQLHFPDASTFARFFKRAAGLSPTVYKQAV